MTRRQAEEQKTIVIIAIIAIDKKSVMAVDRTSGGRVYVDVPSLKTLLKLPETTSREQLLSHLTAKLDISMDGKVSEGLFYAVSIELYSVAILKK